MSVGVFAPPFAVHEHRHPPLRLSTNMDIPRGHAMLPLNEADFLDFIFNYFKAEYSPIRSFWATATAEPRQPQRWVSMGHELAPLTFRPANAQAQKDLESLDYFVRQKNLDASFVRGLVIRFAKYELHERLEKRLFESCRLDLMVRKALKEKHLIDALWPSPAPRNIKQELLQQGVQIRKWYGDMFSKYFRHLHSIDDFSLRPEVDQRIKSSGTLMLVPFVDHLVFGTVDPIMPIVAKGAGYANSAAWKTQKDRGVSFGEPDRFEIRFDAPNEIEDTHTKSVVRQCQCLKCGTKRDVTVVISVDPNPGPAAAGSGTRSSNTNASASRGKQSKAAQRYSPGYAMPGTNVSVPRRPTTPPAQQQQPPAEETSASPVQKKQCPRCTFLNHPDLTTCEMCQSELPATVVSKPPSPVLTSRSKTSHSHSASLPPSMSADTRQPLKQTEGLRPAAPSRHSLSSTLFSIFPFSQQHQTEHHANLPPTQPSSSNPPIPAARTEQAERPTPKGRQSHESDHHKNPSPPPTTTHDMTDSRREEDPEPSTPPLNQRPETAMLPLSPPPTSRNSDNPFSRPTGLPQNLMDDFVPVSPSFPREEEDEINAGWGEMSREEAKRVESSDDEEEEVEEVGRRNRDSGGLIDLDEVAREEMGVWGERED